LPALAGAVSDARLLPGHESQAAPRPA